MLEATPSAPFNQLLAERMQQLGLVEADISERFDVSIPGVKRWLSGQSEPHPAVQRVVISRLSLDN